MEGLQLPQKCGVILLSDTVLFPHGALPLHIFEPRYRAMLADAIQGNCFFCVGNLLEAREGDSDQRPASIGTLGLIRASREAENGTSNVLLHGVMRFPTPTRRFVQSSIQRSPKPKRPNTFNDYRTHSTALLAGFLKRLLINSTRLLSRQEIRQPHRMPSPNNSFTTPKIANGSLKPLKSGNDSIF